MKPYALINLLTLRVIQCDDKPALMEAMRTFRDKQIPMLPLKLMGDQYGTLEHHT